MNAYRFRAATMLAVGLAALGLVACGGSSKSPSAATSASVTTTANGRPDPAKLRACLAQHGVKLPARPAGAPGGSTTTRTAPPAGGPPAGGRRGFFFGGGPNVSPAQRAKLQAAFQACGGRAFRRFGGGPGRFRANAPAFRAALAKYVACVRRNGFDLPAPNTSGKGPVFDPRKVNQRDPKFLAASAKCQQLLRGSAGTPGSGAPPPAGSGA